MKNLDDLFLGDAVAPDMRQARLRVLLEAYRHVRKRLDSAWGNEGAAIVAGPLRT